MRDAERREGGGVEGLSAYIPEDRRQAMARGVGLSDRTTGAALFADLSGFTPMTEALTRAYGPHRGAEELTRQLGLVFGALIRQVDLYGGAVIGFSGDAITCWFDGDDDGLRATAASMAMQEAMAPFATIALAGGEQASLRVKTAVVVGPVRRFLVGDPDIQLIDAVAGEALDRLAEAERLTESGEVVVAERIAAPGASVSVSEWRHGDTPGDRFAVVERLSVDVPTRPWPELDAQAISSAHIASWVLPGVYERLSQGLGAFLADFRPAAALFLSFHGIDYDGDDQAGEKLDAFVRWVQSRISAYEGSLVQLTIGDKGSSYLYASFGAPVAHEDDAARAVAVALEIQALAPGLEFVQNLRIGVTHGQMYAGAYGSPTRRTYGVLGAKTNLAARLMGKATAGQILCDEEVMRRASKTFVFTSLGSVKVKGKEEEVPIYAPEGLSGTLPGQDGAAADGPLIGRRGELATFESVLNEVAAGNGRVSFLEGEAGIGKTRLMRAVAARAAERGATVLIGGGQSGAQQMPYRVWRDVFTALFGLNEVPDDAERRARVEAAAAAAVPHMQSIVPLLNDVLPLALPDTPTTSAMESTARQEALGALLLALLRHTAKQAPLFIILEDAHWLDSLSWELAERVARTLLDESSTVWVLVVHRPLEEQHLGAKAAEALHALPESSVVSVGPLEADELVALVAARLGLGAAGVPTEVADLMRDRANGNPFIAEELLQTLRDQLLITIEQHDGGARCRVSPELAQGQFSLPDTLQGLILSRLDRLPADRQLVLKVASVIGRIFTMTPLRDTLSHLGWAERALKPSLLRELTRRGFVLPESIAPELRYLFRQTITHEIVYQTLLFAQRRQVHQALAEWYELAHPEPGRELTPVLAHHWSQAAEGSEDGELIGKAQRYLMLSGRQAAQLGAFPEALATYARALALLPENGAWISPRAALLIEMGTVLERTGDYGEASERLRRGLELARTAGDPRMSSQALTVLGTIEQRQGNFGAGEGYLEEALALIEGLDNRPELARAWESLGLLSAHQGHFARAIERLEAAYALHEALGNLDGVSATLNNLGIVAIFRTDFVAARGYLERALEIARDRGDREGVGMFLANLGYVAENLRDYEGAERYLQEALDIARELNARHSIYNTTVNLAHVAVGLNHDDAAESGYRSAFLGALEIGALPIALEALCGLALLDHRAARLTRAAERLGLVLAHTAVNADVTNRADPLLDTLREAMTADELAVAMARGAQRSLEDESALVSTA